MKIAFLAPKTISSFFGPSLAKMNVIFLFYTLLRTPVQKSVMGPSLFFSSDICNSGMEVTD